MKSLNNQDNATTWFRAARDRAMRPDCTAQLASDGCTLASFNWALDYFDHIPDRQRRALIVVDEAGVRRASYGELAAASNRCANYLRQQGAIPGDHVLLMMANSIDYYVAKLACMKLGLPLVSVFTDLPQTQLERRIHRGHIRHVIADVRGLESLSKCHVGGLRIAAGTPPNGWLPLASADDCSERFVADQPSRPTDKLMAYFTSGTTSEPKLVWHSHESYPIGHLSSLRWHGITRQDVHLNISSPGWAKHAWSSFFVPFSAEATGVVFANDRPDPTFCVEAMRTLGVTSFCAPPSYWRALVRAGLGNPPPALRQVTSAGEAIDAGVSAQVVEEWGLHIRNGYGQTEATAMIGFAPGQEIVPGGLGYPLPGYCVKLVDPVTGAEAREGEICLDLEPRPVGLMLGYANPDGIPQLPSGHYYRTGDLARRDDRGCLHLLGRLDDMFKSYDVRVSPLEIERCLQRHPLVAEVAVFPMRDLRGEFVPAAACVPVDRFNVDVLPASLLRWQRDTLPPHQRVERVWTVERLPKTLSGKISRACLRQRFADDVLTVATESDVATRGKEQRAGRARL